MKENQLIFDKRLKVLPDKNMQTDSKVIKKSNPAINPLSSISKPLSIKTLRTDSKDKD